MTIYRIPDWVYTDQAIYQREVERIFHGRTWNYVALEAEVPNPGDFIRSNVGPTPVVVARGEDGSINVFENRCAHRGAEFCRELERQRAGIRLPVSSVDLRSERQSGRRSVPPRRRRQGRHAGRFRHQGSRAAQARGHNASRRRVRVLRGRHGNVRGLSRPRSVARIRGDVRRPQAESARLLSPFAAGQLEALSREPQGPVSRDAAAHLSGDVRADGCRQSLADARRQERTARRDGLGQIRRQGNFAATPRRRCAPTRKA